MARTSFFTGFPLNENQTVYVEDLLRQLGGVYEDTSSILTETTTARDQAVAAAQSATSSENISVAARDDALVAKQEAQDAAYDAEQERLQAQQAAADAEGFSQAAANSAADATDVLDQVTNLHGDVSTAVTQAENARDSAQDASTLAEKWASEDENVPVVPGQFSAKHWSLRTKKYGARYSDASSLKPLNVNGTLLEGGGFPRSTVEELEAIYTGGNPDGSLPQQAATDLAECLIIPPTEDSTNFVFPEVPWISLGGAPRRVVPMDWRTILYNTPVGPPLFEPVMTNGWGHLVVRYIGEEPIHTVLKGSISALVRVGSVQWQPDAYARHILRLRTLDAPQLEMGENSGTRSLASSVGAHTPATPIEDYWEFNDLCFPLTQDIIDLADTNDWPDYYVGSEQGFFNSGDTDEALRQEDDDGPIGPEVQTTKWMTVEGEDFLQHCFFFDFDGEGFRRRVQLRMEDGRIRTFYPMTNDTFSAKAIYRLPVGTAQVRIYYTGRGSTASNPQFRRMNFLTSNNTDPLKGLWNERQFDVCRDVVFWPGAQYYFEIFTQVWGASARDYGFRFPSGGLSFTFDAGRLRKKWASTLFERSI